LGIRAGFTRRSSAVGEEHQRVATEVTTSVPCWEKEKDPQKKLDKEDEGLTMLEVRKGQMAYVARTEVVAISFEPYNT